MTRNSPFLPPKDASLSLLDCLTVGPVHGIEPSTCTPAWHSEPISGCSLCSGEVMYRR